MKFLIDAHLPPSLVAIFQAAGHDALHTSLLPIGNRTPDQIINELSMTHQRVVISKDTDFYYSHLLHGKPSKLLLVCTGNIRAREIKALFERRMTEIVAALGRNALVELHRTEVKVVA